MLIHNIFKINPMQVGYPLNKENFLRNPGGNEKGERGFEHPQSGKNNPTIIRLTHFMLTDKGVNNPL